MLYNVLKYDIIDDETENANVHYQSISYELGLRFESVTETAHDKLETNPGYYFNLEDKKHRGIPIDGFA